MKKESKIEQEVEAILSSIDNIKRAEAPDYFYTRLIARMERNESAPTSKLLQLFSKPVIGISVLVVFLVLNVVAIRGVIAIPKTSKGSMSDAQNFATEYNLNTTSMYSN
jgi:hypothetical protein